MIRFIQYPRNSVENLNRALYIKLLKTQWLSDRKFIPFPAGKGRWKFPKTTRNENIKKLYHIFSNLYLLHFYFFLCCSVCSWIDLFFLIGMPEDILNQEFLQTRVLCKFSTEFLGCWTNRIVHTSVMYVSEFTTLVQMGIVNARLILQTWLRLCTNSH